MSAIEGKADMTRTLEQCPLMTPPQGETTALKRLRPICTQGFSSVEHTGDTEEFPKAADLTDDQLAAIVAGAKSH
jgi:hypothetical protein